MATTLHRPLRHATSLVPRGPLRVSNQMRGARVLDNAHLPPHPPPVRFLQQNGPPSETVLDRYRDRLARKAREEGVDDIEALRAAYARRFEEVRKRDTEAVPAANTLKSTPTPTPRPRRNPADRPVVAPLSSILDPEKIRDLPNAELVAVWRLRHAQSPHRLCAAVPGATYRAMHAAARSAPQFVLPVPHEGAGAELHFLQWTFGSGGPTPDAAAAPATTTTVLFTHLAEYKAKGEFALPHTTVTHHLDLLAERDLVLMEGTVVEGRGVSPQQAQWLVMGLQRFYGAPPDGPAGEERTDAAARTRTNRRQLVEWFAKGDPQFSVDMLLEEAERLA